MHKSCVSRPISETICSCAMKASLDLDVSVIIVFTTTGNTAFQIAKYRPYPVVLAVTNKPATAMYSRLGFGLQSLLIENMNELKSETLIKM